MKWFYDLKIQAKLLVSFGFVMILLIFLGLFSELSISSMNSKTQEISGNRIQALTILADMNNNISSHRRQELQHIMSTTAEMEQYEKAMNNCVEIIKKDEVTYKPLIASDEGRKLYNDFTEAWKKYTDISQGVIVFSRQNQNEEAKALVRGESKARYDEAASLLSKLVELNKYRVAETTKQAAEVYSSVKLWVYIVIGFSLITVFFLSRFISNLFSRRINIILDSCRSLENICLTNLENGSKKMADGELDFKIQTGTKPIEITSKDEISQIASNINQIIQKLHGSIGLVENASGSVRNLVTEAKMLVDSALNGRLSERGNADKFKGGYREVIEGLNGTLDAVVTPMNESIRVLDVMSKGDLTIRMDGEYRGDYKSLKDSINILADSMSNALFEVNEAVQATASAANEISSSSEQMAAGAQEQSQQATEVAGAIEEMTKTVYETAKNANEAAGVSRGSSSAADKGAKKIEETKKGIEKIVSSSDETSRIVASLSKRSEQIGEITQVIDDIADQTNLLALNAAIEAARAGEQGRGFAVVADEVRKLAERTTKATKEIAETIKAIQMEAKDADSAMGESKAAVVEGMRMTEEVSEVLSEILMGAQKTTDVVMQVAAASEEQSSAAEQISKNIEGISSVTQQSAAGTEQIARAAEDLNRLTVNLQELVARFKLEENKQKALNSFAVRTNGRLIRQ